MSAPLFVSAYTQLRLRPVVLLLAALCSGASQANADLPALLGKDPAMFDFKISPDGQHLAAKVIVEDSNALVFFDSATLKMLNSVRMGGRSRVGEYHWVSNERVIFKLTESTLWEKEPKYYGELYGVNINGSKRGLLFGYRAAEQQVGSNFKKREARQAWADFVDVVPDENNRILITSTPMTKDGESFPEVLAMDIYSGRTQSRGRLPTPLADVVPAPDGRPRVAAGQNSRNEREVFVRSADSKSSDWSALPATGFGNTFTPIAVSADNKSLLALDNRGTSLTGVHKLDLTSGKSEEIYTDAKVDVTTTIQTADGRAVYGIRVDDGKPAYILLTGEYDEAKIFKDLFVIFRRRLHQLTGRNARCAGDS